jgi:hypothetical protein
MQSEKGQTGLYYTQLDSGLVLPETSSDPSPTTHQTRTLSAILISVIMMCVVWHFIPFVFVCITLVIIVTAFLITGIAFAISSAINS